MEHVAGVRHLRLPQPGHGLNALVVLLQRIDAFPPLVQLVARRFNAQGGCGDALEYLLRLINTVELRIDDLVRRCR